MKVKWLLKCNCFRVGRGYLSNGVRANGDERSLFGCFHVLWVNAGGGLDVSILDQESTESQLRGFRWSQIERNLVSQKR